MRIWPAVLVDALCVLIFATVGRLSHGESAGPVGIANTAWPFLAGLAVGWLLARVWRRPAALVAGLAVWIATLAVGILLRWAVHEGIQLSFVVVAAIFLALTILGWRAVLRLTRARGLRSTPV